MPDSDPGRGLDLSSKNGDKSRNLSPSLPNPILSSVADQDLSSSGRNSPASQQMRATSISSTSSAKDDAAASASYGTRSRHRTGPRPNYSDDKDTELEDQEEENSSEEESDAEDYITEESEEEGYFSVGSNEDA